MFNQRLFKIIIGGLAVVLILLSFVVIQGRQQNLEVIFLDVGQGDAILIKSPYGQKILIDGGPDKKVLQGLGKHLPFYDQSLDLVILTHAHSDHVAGLVEVLERYKVDKIFDTGVLHPSPDYLAFLEVIKEKNLSLEIINQKKEINLGPDLILEIIYPVRDLAGRKVENLNNISIVARLVHEDAVFLFTGDAEDAQEEELLILYEPEELESNILKAGHHGSSTSSSQEFVNAVSPRKVIIQVGEGNKFGHPSRRTVKRLERLGAEVFRNDLSGEIKIVSDGQQLQVELER